MLVAVCQRRQRDSPTHATSAAQVALDTSRREGIDGFYMRSEINKTFNINKLRELNEKQGYVTYADLPPEITASDKLLGTVVLLDRLGVNAIKDHSAYVKPEDCGYFVSNEAVRSIIDTIF